MDAFVIIMRIAKKNIYLNGRKTDGW